MAGPILDIYRASELNRCLCEVLSASERSAIMKGLSGSQASLVIAACMQTLNRKSLVVLPDKEEAAYFYNDLQQFIPEGRLFFFPQESRIGNGQEHDIEAMERTLALKSISGQHGLSVIVTSAAALRSLHPLSREITGNSLMIRKGEVLNMEDLIEHLNDIRFDGTDFVYRPGQFSWRGGIIDFFSFDGLRPVRIEFDGDKVESVREFDIESQLTEKELTEVSLTPDSGKIEGAETATIAANLPGDGIIFIRDIDLIVEKLNAEEENPEGGEGVKSAGAEAVLSEIRRRNTACFGQFVSGASGEMLDWRGSPQPAFNKNFELLAADLRAHDKNSFTTYITASDANQVRRLYEIFEDIGRDVNINPFIASLHEGFIDAANKVVCYTDHQIFGRYHRFRLRSAFADKSSAIGLRELTGLKPGDFITHIDHGVGRFSGLEKIEVNGKKQEAVRIIYRNNDVLYISIHSIHRISRYVGKEGTEPKLDKLGSNAWQNLKQKTKSRVKELAFDLIKLYAKRKTRPGFAFSPDSYMQTELEASFMYEDTADQLKATRDVKSDMEAAFPMDRLVCGDVGFGKTEIAVRAAFKAAADNKQVAILVPTTILAMQHYKTFSKRLEHFPCRIDYLNRFRSAAEQKKIISGIADGSIDIIIGTHILLSEKIRFKDLGLMIIDEEQKFGVGAKDKLKTIKVDVDTLTLTATPIPRTLQFSMMGARDLSVISTPPPNRLPIETRLCEFNEDIIREAVEFEISRGGQVFFINNRIENIGEIGHMVEQLCPGVRVLVAHGQLKGHELEKKMTAFIEGQFDVLVSTTIVESGLDIPNANTIIINKANHFGLSDLHQMRGRVGRSDRKAFCYLLIPPPSTLTTQAMRRLRAIEQLSDIGSGFQIAMRDLDIRGAGDIFGAEQSGFIAEIGFDMYQKILQEAIAELKEKEFSHLFEKTASPEFVTDCLVETDLEILLPDEYVSQTGERLSLYRELDEISNEEGLQRFRKSLEDRFGPLPKSGEELLEVLRLRWMAKSLGMEKVILKNGSLISHFTSDKSSSFYQSDVFRDVLNFIQQHHKRCKMTEKDEKLRLRINDVDTIASAIGILASMSRVAA